MRIKVPFEYSARVTLKRHRSPEIKSFWEWTEVEVEEFDPDDAPVAVRWNDTLPKEAETYRERDRWGAYPEDGIRETRWIGGAHYWDLLLRPSEGHHSASRFIEAEDLQRLCAQGHDDSPLMSYFSPRWKPSENPGGYPLDPDPYRLIEDCTRDREAGIIRARAEDLVIVGGRLYRRDAEPVLHLQFWYAYGHSYQSVIKVLPANSNVITDRTAVYRADRFDEAAQAAILDNGAEVPCMNEARRPEILLWESLRYRDEETAFVAATTKIADSLAGTELSKISTGLGTAWFGLRDALHLEAGSDEKLDAIEEALSEYASAADGASDSARTALRVLERWRSRPIDLDPDEAVLPKP